MEITPEITRVEIISESACSACHAKGLCSLSESKTKTVDVRTSGWAPHQIGDEVEVVLKATMGIKAVWLAYVVPLFVLVIVLMGLIAFDFPELTAGLCAIGAVAVYYLVIWIFRSRLQNEYVFTIR